MQFRRNFAITAAARHPQNCMGALSYVLKIEQLGTFLSGCDALATINPPLNVSRKAHAQYSFLVSDIAYCNNLVWLADKHIAPVFPKSVSVFKAALHKSHKQSLTSQVLIVTYFMFFSNAWLFYPRYAAGIQRKGQNKVKA